MYHIDLFRHSVAFHVETSHLICISNQITGFYMKCNAGLKYINVLFLLGTLNIYFVNGKGVKVKFEFRIVWRICAKKV